MVTGNWKKDLVDTGGMMISDYAGNFSTKGDKVEVKILLVDARKIDIIVKVQEKN